LLGHSRKQQDVYCQMLGLTGLVTANVVICSSGTENMNKVITSVLSGILTQGHHLCIKGQSHLCTSLPHADDAGCVRKYAMF